MYKRAISLDPNNPVAYHNLANTYKKIGRIKEAIEEYQKAIAVDKNFIFSYLGLADLYFRNKNYSKAKEILEKALLISPDSQAIKNSIALLEDLI
jgi:Tfp pilus assembly protein PilF